jgi:hypothetical protein
VCEQVKITWSQVEKKYPRQNKQVACVCQRSSF